MATAKNMTKKDLENKIAKLEAKLSQLTIKLKSKPTTETSALKPDKVPKPSEAKKQPPVTFQNALEDAYINSPMTSFHDYRANVTGYSPAPNRYFVRLTAPVGKVPTSDWNQQKVSVTGYTQPSNQYFATRPRLAYSPPDKTFGSFSGVKMNIQDIPLIEQPQVVEPSKPAKNTTLPKDFVTV